MNKNIKDFIKRNYKKFLGITVAFAIFITGGFGCIALNSETAKEKVKTTIKDTVDKVKEDSKVNDLAVKKDETVYVIADANGDAKKIIVSDWIKNPGETFSDKSNLDDISNVNDNRSYKLNTKGYKVWDTNGKDLFYKGTSDDSLPVDLHVSYYLDGSEISPEDLSGKSGKLKIRFDYKNNQFEERKINNKKEKIYVPFIVTTGMVLNNEIFSNVVVKNGKLINDGDKNMIIGLSLPGLNESLGLSDSDIKFPNYLEITANVKDYENPMTVTYTSNEFLNNLNLENVNTADDLKNALTTLTDSMNALMDGSAKIYDGLKTLLNKSDELIGGIKKLNKGAKQLKNGTKKFSKEISKGRKKIKKSTAQLTDGTDKLSNGADELYNGITTINNQSSKLNSGAEKVYNTLIGQVTSSLKEKGITTDKLTISNYKKVLNNLVNNPTASQKTQLIAVAQESMKESFAAVPKEYQNAVLVIIYDKVSKGVSFDKALSSVNELLTDAGLVNEIGNNNDVTPDKDVFAVLSAKGYSKNVAGLIAKVCTYYVTVKGGVAQNYIEIASNSVNNANIVSEAMNDKQASTKINALLLNKAIEGIKPIIDSAISSLDSYGEFYYGVNAYTDGVNQVADGAKTLTDGAGTLNDKATDGVSQINNAFKKIDKNAKKLKKGAKKLYSGTNKMAKGTAPLKNGINQLVTGSGKLKDGLTQFNDEAIGLLLGGVDDFDGLLQRIKAISEVSRNYNNFSGISDNIEGDVRFIYKTE